MSNMTVTNCDSGSIAIGDVKHIDALLLFAAADTFLRGTLLGRKLLSDTVAVTPDGGNTGTRVLTVTVNAGRTLKVGTYTLLAGTLASGLGPWTLTDPDGISQTVTTAGGGAGDDLPFTELGLVVVVAATGTNFVTGDSADLVVAAQSGTPLVPYSPTGTNGAQVPLAVLPDETTRADAGSEVIRPIVWGEVNLSRLIIDADGDGDNITPAIIDQLRSNGIIASKVKQLSTLDNQA
jgi:hypothetical protein